MDDKQGISQDDSMSSLQKNDSEKEDKHGTSIDDSKSPSEKNNFDINDEKKAPEVPSVPFSKTVDESHIPDVMFQPLIDPSEESGPETSLKADDKERVYDIKEDHETSKDMSPLEIQDKPNISEDIVTEDVVTPSNTFYDNDIGQISLKANDTNNTLTRNPETHSKSSLHVSINEESSEAFKRSRQENSENEEKSLDYIEIPLQDSSSEERSDGENKRRVSIAPNALEKPVYEPQNRWQAKARPSFLRRKIVAFEKELTLDNINKRISTIFHPGRYRSGSDESSDGSKDASDSTDDENGAKPERSYLSPTMASVFIISICTGYSITSLPFYLKKSSWFGVFFIILFGLNSMYSALCIGWSWIIMEEMWPEYLGYSRIPYQEISYRAAGKIMKYFVALNVDVSVLLTCSIFILLIADSLENIVYTHVPFCYLLIIVTVFLLPFSMYSSYKDMQYIGIIDGALSVLYLFLLVVGLFLDKPLSQTVNYQVNDFSSLLVSFGGFSFAYGCGPALSNILMDMEDKTMFTHSCATGFLVVILIYVTLAIMGYAAYGDTTTPFILQKIMTNETFRPIGILIDIVFIIQMITTFAVFLLPSLLQFEARVNCKDRFSICRVLLRLAIIACMLLLVLGLPHVAKYLEIVGATSINILTFILPPICYMLLVLKCPKNSGRKIYKKEWILLIETIVVGTAVAIISAMRSYKIEDPTFKTPLSCYYNMSLASPSKKWIRIRRLNE